MKRGVSRKYNESSQDMHYQVIPEGIKLSPRIRIYNISDNTTFLITKHHNVFQICSGISLTDIISRENKPATVTVNCICINYL